MEQASPEKFLERLQAGVNLDSLRELIRLCDDLIIGGVLPAEFAAIGYLLHRLEGQWDGAALSPEAYRSTQSLLQNQIPEIVRLSAAGEVQSARAALASLAQKFFRENLYAL